MKFDVDHIGINWAGTVAGYIPRDVDPKMHAALSEIGFGYLEEKMAKTGLVLMNDREYAAWSKASELVNGPPDASRWASGGSGSGSAG